VIARYDKLPQAQRAFLYDQIRSARMLILRDAEAFHGAATVLEHLGQALSGTIKTGLGRYESELLTLIGSHRGPPGQQDAARLFKVVRDARNMAVHDGAWARHLGSRLVDLFILIEDAMTPHLTLVSDLMVRNPSVIEPWQTVAEARRTMLANSFSSLPLELNGSWHLVSDVAIMRYLRAAQLKEERTLRLATSVEEAVSRETGLQLQSPVFCRSTDSLELLLSNLKDGPVLVMDCLGGQTRLCGIITPFDLL
jgi:CBS domain-containing protein